MQDYFVYLPDNPKGSVWGVTALSVGYTRVLPGSPYPPYRHPDDHHFSWATGRILQSYTCVFVTEGAGTFESEVTQRAQRVEAGTMMLVFPGVWHRYAPDPKTGWVEQWLECRGPAVDRIVQAGVISPEHPLIHTGQDPDLLFAYERCLTWVRQDSLRHQSALSTMALHVMALLEEVVLDGAHDRQHMAEVVKRAQALIMEQRGQALNMEVVARKLGVGYSHFRHAFKKRTGMSPKQYHLHLRLQKAQDFLANTAHSVKEVSELLGFDSPCHLSSQFKRHVGVAPQLWRQRFRRDPAREL